MRCRHAAPAHPIIQDITSSVTEVQRRAMAAPSIEKTQPRAGDRIAALQAFPQFRVPARHQLSKGHKPNACAPPRRDQIAWPYCVIAFAIDRNAHGAKFFVGRHESRFPPFTHSGAFNQPHQENTKEPTVSEIKEMRVFELLGSQSLPSAANPDPPREVVSGLTRQRHERTREVPGRAVAPELRPSAIEDPPACWLVASLRPWPSGSRRRQRSLCKPGSVPLSCFCLRLPPCYP